MGGGGVMVNVSMKQEKNKVKNFKFHGKRRKKKLLFLHWIKMRQIIMKNKSSKDQLEDIYFHEITSLIIKCHYSI